jgi:hypothetical protein
MAVHEFIIKEKQYYFYYLGNCNALVLPHEIVAQRQINQSDTIALHCGPEDPKNKRHITPIYRSVVFIGPGNMDETNGLTIIGLR